MNKIKSAIINKAIEMHNLISFTYEGKIYQNIQPLDSYEMTQTLYLRTQDFLVFEIEKLEKLTIQKEHYE